MNETPAWATLVTTEQLGRVHAASLDVLESTGLLVHSGPARELLLLHGCEPVAGSSTIRLPRTVVERYRRLVPPAFTFRGREPRWDRTIPGDGPLHVTGSSAPDLIDPETGILRRATSADLARIARLIQALDGYDVFSISTLAADAPPGLFTPARLLPALRHCAKPIRTTTADAADLAATLRLVSAVAGSEAAFRARPFVTFHYCPVVSPLSLDVLSTGALMTCVERGLPVYSSIVPNAGLTSPMSLAGTLVQGNAEFLAITVLMQMIRAGTPTIYATLPTVADLRTGAYASGGIECGMLHMAFAQLARFYGVPSGGYVGMTNAKVADAQAGYETGMSAVAGVLGGADLLNMGGLLDALRAFDFGKAVIDDDIARMLKRLRRGISLTDDDLAVSVIREVGPGGTYLESEHTMARLRTEAFIPSLADRDARGLWESNGALDTSARAMRRVRSLLEGPALSRLSPDIESRVQAAFPALAGP